MSADDLIRVVSDVLFVAIGLGAVALAVRERRRAAVDAALMFGALALVILQGEASRIAGIVPPDYVGKALVVVLLAVPYLFLRLVDDLVGLRARVLQLALAGSIVSAAALTFASTPYPGALVLGVVLYFGVAEIYGAIVLVREAAGTSGVPRRRAQAAAVGSLLLGATLLVAGAAQLLPQAGPFAQAATRVLVLCSALAYAVSVVPPGWLKRAWLEPELRRFLAGVAAIPPDDTTDRIARRLEASAAHALGATRAVIALGADAVPPDMALEAGARGAVVVAPIVAGGRRLGILAAVMRRAPLFYEDDRELVRLLADQAALVLDGSRLYADLAAANHRLEDATRAKSEFLANMSHELRTPLNAVLGFADLLVEQLDGHLTSPQRRYFTNIKDAGNHLLDLINEVLDLSKVEAGRLEIRPEAIRISTLLDPVLAAARDATAGVGHRFEARVDRDAVVSVDPGRTRQILYNLVSNAVKFTPRGGEVQLVAELRGRDLRFEVSDTGIGIPADKRDRVFGTFERLHEGRSEASGTGLGLALTKKLVELHGGSISFESEEGRGTVFSVAIPDVGASVVRGPRVLIVEDERRDAELLAALAAGVGVATEIVGTASAARDALGRERPLAVVLDLRLPDERGEALLEQIKRDAALRSIPVLVVTVEDDEGRSRPLGADDHLTKPIDRERVSEWMRAVASRPAEATTAAS